MDYLDRYLAGEHEQVWAELVALGSAVREEPLYADALAVAHETMRRVRHNIETLIPRLEALGYVFGYGWVQRRSFVSGGFPSGAPLPPFTPSTPTASETVAVLEGRAGILPLSLRAFYEVVGSVNFIGEVPETWTDRHVLPDDLDALFIYPVQVATEDAEPWQERYGDLTAEDWALPGTNEEDLCDACAYRALPRDCSLVPIAPDEWHKYDVSGCGAYEIATPNEGADARLLTERHRTTFVNYLRICLRWGGLPGLERISDPPLRDLANLTEGLLPL